MNQKNINYNYLNIFIGFQFQKSYKYQVIKIELTF